MSYKKVMGSTLIASGVIGASAFAQGAEEPSDINFDEDYEEIVIYQTEDEELLNKLKRYLNSKKKEARILNAETDDQIEQIIKRARNAGTEEAKLAARQAIKQTKSELKRLLADIRSDMKQAIKRARMAAQRS